jgi:hypothetical protein
MKGNEWAMDAFGAGGYLGVTQLSAILPRPADERPDESAGNLAMTLELARTSVGYAASNLSSWPAAVGRQRPVEPKSSSRSIGLG